jgi:hypothetical protein
MTEFSRSAYCLMEAVRISETTSGKLLLSYTALQSRNFKLGFWSYRRGREFIRSFRMVKVVRFETRELGSGGFGSDRAVFPSWNRCDIIPGFVDISYGSVLYIWALDNTGYWYLPYGQSLGSQHSLTGLASSCSSHKEILILLRITCQIKIKFILQRHKYLP